MSEMARARLEVLRATNDGFEVAQRDLYAAVVEARSAT